MIFIVGPTSTGKTSLGIKLAKHFKYVNNFEIISADSRQIYKDMDIGTGKRPLKLIDTEYSKHDNYWEIGKTKIWGYDIACPDEKYSAFEYLEYTKRKIKDLREKYLEPIVIGGTGFYIDLILGRKSTSEVKPDWVARDELEKLSLDELKKTLLEQDSGKYSSVDTNNKRRLIRAIEVTKNPVQESTFFMKNINDDKNLLIGLTAERKSLYEHVDTWVDSIWQNGLVEETKTIMEKYPNTDKLEGLVYSTAVAYIKSELSEEEAVQRTKYDLHGYIRRQQTWFKKNPDVHWIDIQKNDAFKESVNLIQSYLGEK